MPRSIAMSLDLAEALSENGPVMADADAVPVGHWERMVEALRQAPAVPEAPFEIPSLF